MTTINTPIGWDEKLRSKLEWLSPEEKDKLLEILKQDKKERNNLGCESLYWNKDAILDDLIENHVYIDEDIEIEMLGHRWKLIYINLPKIGNFEWFKFDCFISDYSYHKKEFESGSEYDEKLYSMDEIADLLEALNRYMRAYWVNMDENVDFKKDLYWKNSKVTTDTWECLKKIIDLDRDYWLGDKDVDEMEWTRACWFCGPDSSFFSEYNDYDDDGAKLLMKLSD